MPRISPRWLACLLVGLTLGTASLPAGAETKMPYGQGLLWKIEREGSKPSYLFGTIHVNFDEIVKLPKPVRDAFDKADSASFEIEWDRHSGSRWARSISYRDWRSLDDTLGQDLYSRIVDKADEWGYSLHTIRKLQPWALILEVGGPTGVYIGRKGDDDQKILDNWLQDEAKDQGKRVYGLETIEEHTEIFADLPEDVVVTIIEAMLAEDRFERRVTLSRSFEKLIQLYLDRDTEAMFNLDDDLVAGLDPELQKMLDERILDRRNAMMAERMELRIREGNAFVAVGCAHLPGEHGMLNILAQRGYKVTRVY